MNETYIQDKILEMKVYLHYSEMEFSQKYASIIERAMELGWIGRSEYIQSIRDRDPNKLTTIEKLMLDELKEFDQIKEEILALELAESLKEPEIVLPFPMEGKFREEFISVTKKVFRDRTVNMLDTSFIPFQFPEETFDDRLRKIPSVDIDEEIRKCI